MFKNARYAIREINMGAASVAVALGFYQERRNNCTHGHRRSNISDNSGNLQKRRKIRSGDKAVYEVA